MNLNADDYITEFHVLHVHACITQSSSITLFMLSSLHTCIVAFGICGTEFDILKLFKDKTVTTEKFFAPKGSLIMSKTVIF